MKKKFVLSALVLIFTMSGCSTGSRNVTVTTPMNVSTPVSVSTPVAVYVDKDGEISDCASCEKEEPENRCAKKVRFVNYNDTCHNLCGFTVTERSVSNCDSETPQVSCSQTKSNCN
jgi:hypothetical protein